MDELPAKKSLGQHWLRDEESLKAIVKAADVNKDDTVLEIGPGLGTLTAHLVKSARKVIAVELDEVLAGRLLSQVPSGNLIVRQQDILRFDLGELPSKYKVVANIPYYLIAVAAQLDYEVKLGKIVPADKFTPPPKVDSQVVVFKKRAKPLFKDLDRKLYMRVVKAGFSAKRKKLRSSLSAGLTLEKPQMDELLKKAKVSGELRAQNLSLEQWFKIYKALVV
jgi:16S rRNA (adenine1518-N6/adenine1519-N6)-dimethyltransferase